MYPTSDFQGGWRPPSGPFSAPPPPPRPPYYPRGPPPPNRHRFPGASGRFPVPGSRPMGWFPPPGVPPPPVRFSPNCSTPPPSWQAGGAAAEGQTTGPTQHRSLSAPPPLQPPAGRGDTHGGGPRTDERFHWRRNKSRAESGPNLRTDRISEEGEERRREARSGSEGGPPRREDGRRARWEDDGRLRRESDGRSRRADDRWKDDCGRSGRESNSRSERSGQQNVARPGNEISSERVDSRSRDDERVGERVDGRSQGAELVGERVESRSRGDDRAGSERSDGSRPRQREEGSRRFPDRSEAGWTRRSESGRSNKEGRASRTDSDRERRSRYDDDRSRGNRSERKRRRPDDTGSESDASERRGSSQRERRDGERSRAQRPRKAPDLAADSTSAQDLVSEEAMTERDKRFAEEERLMREKQDMISKALEDEKLIWTRSSPADPFYQRHSDNLNLMVATKLTVEQCDRFRTELVERKSRTCAELPPVCLTPITAKRHVHNCGGSDSDDTSSDSSESEDETMLVHEELERKSRHPYRLHTELWYNDCGKMNVGDVCRCSIKARQAGIRHNIYAGEEPVPRCDPHTNNVDRLYHYRVLICPPTNFLVSRPTSIMHDGHEFIFEGLSLLSHYRLTELPPCHIIRFNIEYTVLYMEEKLPDNFVMEEVDLFTNFLYESLLEMVDLDVFPHADKDRTGCPMFHIMPRFVRDLANNGKEILALNEVISYLLANDGPLVEKEELEEVTKMPQWDWQNRADAVRGMLVTHPARKPSCIRLDQLDREVLPKDKEEKEEDKDKEEVEYHFPEIVHFGIRPPQLSYAGNPEYQKAWREYVKYRHLLANLPKPTMDDKRKLAARESQLQALRLQANLKRDVTVAVSCEGFRRTGLMADVVQHALFLPVLICHLRFHKSLNVLEKTIDYEFKNRSLLQLALTHPSYRENHGTNRDHSRNSLSNCGIRQPEYGDRCINYTATRKRGLNILINIMSQFGKKEATESRITHNERLEFLGDAVVEFLTSIHLFFMFPNLEEGGLATYRAAIVQNQHLAVLARSLGLHEFLLYGHGSDLCHDLELRHAMANCFEALMGALFLDSGIEVADKVFSRTLFMDNEQLLHIWQHYPPHPLQEQEPQGDRKWIEKFPRLQQMQEFEGLIGVEFMHIRLLARAFTDRSIGFNNLTLGSNQRLEFLGDTVLQLIASEYLYRHFPEHHEGHLSLLRSSLVNNRTQAVVCTDLGMTQYAAYSHLKTEIKMKDRADLLEALIGALYVDKGLEFCRKFCEVCFFPRLQLFILNQDWNDPKSKLQQCCLTLRNMDSSEPDIPIYKVIECLGPTNTRVYSVAVYFQGKRLAKASGHSIQMAEMNAASQALENCKPLFPQLDHQHRVIAKSIRIQTKKLEEHFGADVTKGSAMVYQMR